MEQVTSISNQGTSYPSSAAARGTANRVQAPIIDPSHPLTLRGGTQRALKTLGFDASGNPIAISTTISPALAAFCASATLIRLEETTILRTRSPRFGDACSRSGPVPYPMREFMYLIHICYVSDPHLLSRDLE